MAERLGKAEKQATGTWIGTLAKGLDQAQNVASNWLMWLKNAPRLSQKVLIPLDTKVFSLFKMLNKSLVGYQALNICTFSFQPSACSITCFLVIFRIIVVFHIIGYNKADFGTNSDFQPGLPNIFFHLDIRFLLLLEFWFRYIFLFL